ncbi:hypothetical protein [Subtercola vilae]|uniref:Uncharacterized protein n=1 Tax=Subtercola vilae TaxID=2056433 RepID=A0A4T2C9U4_9MICO|nr:hypothetical protein [Subtercola vilae]TIH40181.1 hypothetical protein D4765_03445 [Subtercola vilae]
MSRKTRKPAVLDMDHSFENDLFADVDLPPTVAPPEESQMPLGGVHPDVINASGTTTGPGMNWSKVTLGLWGIGSTHNNTSWKFRLQQAVTLSDIKQRSPLTGTVSIVSREVGGVELTGAGSLDRLEVVQILENQGYVFTEEFVTDTQHVERFELREE